jgi:hypothetical protein
LRKRRARSTIITPTARPPVPRTAKGKIDREQRVASRYSPPPRGVQRTQYDKEGETKTVSRFLSFIVFVSAAGAAGLGLERTELVAGLPEVVDEGIARLAEYQTEEGGWPWWRGGLSR